MMTLTELSFRILLFEGVAFFLLATVFVSRLFFRQPLDRIRLTQAGFGLVAVALVCVGCGVGPTWTIALPNDDGAAIVRLRIDAEKTVESQSYDYGSVDARYDRSGGQRQQFASVDNIVESPITQEKEEKALLFSHTAQERTGVSPPVLDVSVETHRVYPCLHDGLCERNLTIVTLFYGTFFLPPLILFARDWAAGRRLRRLLRNSDSVPDSVAEIFRQVCGDSRYAVRLRMSNEIVAPMVFGWFRPTLLLPTRLCADSLRELKACLAHEWSHLANGDLVTWNFVRLFRYPLWMQPFYRMLRSRLLADQDYLADDDGVRSCTEIADYARILLDFAKLRSAAESETVLGMADRQSQLRRRIDMLLSVTRPARSANKRRLLLPIILLAALTLLGGGLRFGEATATTTTEPGTVSPTPEGQPPTLVPLSITRNADKEFTVSGILYDKDGKPAVRATVLLYEESNGGPTKDVKEEEPDRTDENGRFVFKGGKMFAVLGRSADESEFFFHRIPQNPNEAKPEEREPVAQMMPGETLTGQVVDKDGKPIEGATVGYYTRHRLNGYSTSGKDGRFTLRYPKGGSKVLALFAFKSKAGLDYCLFDSGFEENIGPKMLNTEIDLTQSFTLTLTGAETVRVKAQWEDGTPAKGITIAPWTLQNPNRKDFVPASAFSDPSLNFAFLQYSTRLVTGADGVVEFDWMPDWLERVDFFYADFPWWSPNVPWLRLSINLKKESREKTMILHKKRKASGIVRYPDGKPAEGITVKYEGANLQFETKRKSTKTDTDGRYEFEIDPEAAYILAVDDGEWAAPAYNPLVVNAATKPEELQNLDFTLRKTVRVHGKATFGPENKFLSGYKIDFPTVGRSDESLPKEKQLTRPPDHQEMCGGDLHYFIFRNTPVDKDGNYSIHLGPGEYKVGIFENYIGMQGLVRNLLPDDTVLTIPEDAGDEIVYDIQAGASRNGHLQGRVQFGDGKPAAGVKLTGVYINEEEEMRISPSLTPEFAAETNGEGRFAAPRTLQTMYLYAKTADGKQQAIVELAPDVQTMETPLTLQPTGAATGRIVDWQGNPLPNVEFMYGILLYKVIEGDNWHDAQRNFPQRIRSPLRFGGNGKADAEGRFRVDSVIAGQDCYVVYRAAKEYDMSGRNTDTFQLAKFRLENIDKVKELGDCRVNPISLDGWKPSDTGPLPRFTARFVDDKTGKPVAGIEAVLRWSLRLPDEKEFDETRVNGGTLRSPSEPRPFAEENPQTDAAGKVEFSYPKAAAIYDPKDVRLSVSCFRYIRDRESYIRNPHMMFSQTMQGPFEPAQDYTFRLIPFDHVTGKVLDPDGKPVKGATVNISTVRAPSKDEDRWVSLHKAMEVLTDDDGIFQVMVTPGFTQGNIQCNASEFIPVQVDLKDRNTDNADDWTFTVHKGTDVSGRVVDMDGKGIPDVWVNFEKGTDSFIGGSIAPIYDYHLGKSMKTDTEGRFVAPSLAREEYVVFISPSPTSPNAGNVERDQFRRMIALENHVFTYQTVDLRTETVPEVLLMIGHPTVALKVVLIDETPKKSALSYSRLLFLGKFPDTKTSWNVQVEGEYDPQTRASKIGTVHLPKGQPMSLVGILIDSTVREGVLTIDPTQTKRNWALEYRFGADAPWKSCTESTPTANDRTSSSYFTAPFEALSGNEQTLEVRIR